ncbi:hypothetical protein OIU77_023790 [Salix suchowensis]|uniref:ribonuclease Z n=1 Tax=Salix suchowensis TaxID=1278906 RepID=A0ABQ9C8W4_9ROSI|nr:hypothetical protein OIU77_023790 [Salix suchowensis]
MKSFIPHAAMVHTKSFAILLRPNQSQGSALKPGDMSVIYLCELAEIMGKFDPEKAKALGLKPGPKYRELQSGRSVMSDHQDIMVLPSDVMDPSVPGPIVLLVDCPTESHVQELLSTESLNSYYVDFSGNPTQIGKTVNCIIHLSPASFFPAPGFWSLTDLNNSRPDSIFSGEGCVSKLYENTSAENLLKFTLRPHANLGFDKSNIPSLMAPSEIINELLSEIPEIVDAAQHVREFWSGPGGLEADINVFQGDKVIEEPWLEENTLPSCLENIRRDDLEVVLLGTGSSQPSKYRNVTSIYINLFSKGSLLLDCGEGTLGQLKRRYGVEGADNALKKFLDAYQILEDLDMQFIDCRSTTEASWVAFEDDSKSKKDDMSLASPNDFAEIKNSTVNTESNLFARGSRMQSYWKRPGNPVDNGMAFGIALKAAERINTVGKAIPGWKIVYSGDTRPCPELVEASRRATILIHEATFEDALVEEAIARNHSTTEEAIEVGNSAGAYRIILTHFSQRYPKIPVFDDTHMHKTCIAFDMMSVNIADLPVLPRVLPYLKMLFRNEMVVDESDDVVVDPAIAVAN